MMQSIYEQLLEESRDLTVEERAEVMEFISMVKASRSGRV